MLTFATKKARAEESRLAQNEPPEDAAFPFDHAVLTPPGRNARARARQEA